ncbi:unnamed protein product, partial [Symbiodinium sp. KB8]
GVDGRWPAVGAVRLQHPRNTPGRHQPPRATGLEAAAAPGPRNWRVSNSRGAVRA